jgi:type IX secretion system PorP/SprF family membrane protein
MRKLYVILFALFISGYCFAQQDPLYSQYLTNPLIFNPAYAGLNNSYNASVSFRNQWAGFEGSPTTLNFNTHSSIVDNKVGVGLMAIRDRAGFLKNNEVQFVGSYKLSLDKYTFSFGMNFGFMNSTYMFDKVTLVSPQDPAFQNNGDMKYSWPNVGVGAILKGEQFIVGLSVPRLTKAKAGESNFLVQSQHVYLYGGYVYYIGTRLRLKPSVLFRGVKGSPISTDLNFNINIDTKYSAGVFVRNFQSYGVLMQAWFLEKVRLGYAFEIPSGASVGPQFTSHELTLGIRLALLNIHDPSYSEF